MSKAKKNSKGSSLSLQLDGYGLIQSDKVYIQTFAQAKRTGLFGLEEIYPINYEFEFSPNLVVVTISQQGEPGWGRVAFEGSFGFRNGRLSQATINRIGQAGKYFDQVTGDFYESGSINAFARPVRLSNVRAVSSWFFPDYGESTLVAGYSIDAANPATPEKDIVEAFGNGRILQNAWFNDPFSPNLV